MNTKDDGGAAFPMPSGPEPRVHSTTHYNEGMSLRDYFAAKAEIPWNAVLETLRLRGEEKPTLHRVTEFRSEMKYMEADAMLAERNR
jgi:hypothetical protein